MPTRLTVSADLATALRPDLTEDHTAVARIDPDETDRRPPCDWLRRAAHVSLVVLLSPALLAVLTVGGVAVFIQVASRIGLRIVPGTARRWLPTRRAPGGIVEQRGRPYSGREMWRRRGHVYPIGRPGITAGEGGERSSLLPHLPIHPMLGRTRNARPSRDASTS